MDHRQIRPVALIEALLEPKRLVPNKTHSSPLSPEELFLLLAWVETEFDGFQHSEVGCRYSRIIENYTIYSHLAVSMFEDFDRRRHSVTKLCVHLVFTTKYRRKVMSAEILEEVKFSVQNAAEKIGCRVLDINGEADHIHILLLFPTSLSIASIVNTLKTVSSRMIRSNHPGILHGGKTGLFWSRSYFAATAGDVTLDILKTYVEKQGCKE